MVRSKEKWECALILKRNKFFMLKIDLTMYVMSSIFFFENRLSSGNGLQFAERKNKTSEKKTLPKNV